MAVSLKKAEPAGVSLVSDPKKKRAIGSSLTGAQLDRRLEKAIKGEEPSISSSEALEKIRRRHRL